jgi:hypothetical protein
MKQGNSRTRMHLPGINNFSYRGRRCILQRIPGSSNPVVHYRRLLFGTGYWMLTSHLSLAVSHLTGASSNRSMKRKCHPHRRTHWWCTRTNSTSTSTSWQNAGRGYIHLAFLRGTHSKRTLHKPGGSLCRQSHHTLQPRCLRMCMYTPPFYTLSNMLMLGIRLHLHFRLGNLLSKHT